MNRTMASLTEEKNFQTDLMRPLRTWRTGPLKLYQYYRISCPGATLERGTLNRLGPET